MGGVAIDWNNDGVFDSDAVADITFVRPHDQNGDGLVNTADTPVLQGANQPVPSPPLSGFDDWDFLLVHLRAGGFRDEVDEFADGAFLPTPDEEGLSPEVLAQLSGGMVYLMPSGNGADHVILRRREGVIELVDAATSELLAVQSAASVNYVEVRGVDGEDDLLTIDFTGGDPIPAWGCNFRRRGRHCPGSAGVRGHRPRVD
jgi:hypothetical protein